jgi:hypothetical protein
MPTEACAYASRPWTSARGSASGLGPGASVDDDHGVVVEQGAELVPLLVSPQWA